MREVWDIAVAGAHSGGSGGAVSGTRATSARNPFAFITWAGAALFFALTTAVSYARWANFDYRTFDLAYYVQGVWQLLHGRLETSILHVPLLGNHIEPIILLFAPFFALWQHPIVFIALQNAALAWMCPVGYDIAQRRGFTKSQSVALAAALLLAPATGFVALHEFHPEALAAPFLLLMIRARLRGSIPAHWVWFCAVLACKENMAFLLVAYCVVGLVVERRHGWSHVRSFYLWPLLVAGAWFVLCAKVITPALNTGNIDYLGLYSGLGNSAGEILRNTVVEPGRMMAALRTSIVHGNLLPGTLLPFLLLPLLRPRWLVVAAPVLLQHLLSWRSSEWMIYFHYAAPLIPLFWIASTEGLAAMRTWNRFVRPLRTAPLLLLIACGAGQWMLGPAQGVVGTARSWVADATERARKNAIVARIPADASVVAPLPYLSHLAQREHCYSLHFLLKGLKTLSHVRYEPVPEADYVLIDYCDTATFDPAAGYYHPMMKTTDGTVVPSSDALLHDFLARETWKAEAIDELVLLSRSENSTTDASAELSDGLALGSGTTLLAIRRSPDRIAAGETISVVMDWMLDAGRVTFPWLELVFVCETSGEQTLMTKGLCAPHVRAGFYRETWQITRTRELACSSSYQIYARFLDNSKTKWSNRIHGGTEPAVLLGEPIALGSLTVLDHSAAPVSR